MSLQGKSLYVLSPFYGGQLTMNYHQSFTQLVALCRDVGVEIGANNVYNESLISRARNRLVDSYLKQNTHTHAVFIDADIGFDPKDVLAMLEMDLDIAGVPCSRKSIRWDRIQVAVARRIFQWLQNTGAGKNGTDPAGLLDQFKKSGAAIRPEDFPKIAGDFVFNFPPFDGNINIQLDKPEIMKHMGTGLLMIKREVFLKFKKSYPDRWYEARTDPASNPGPIHDFFKVGVNPETREYDSEDYWFCKNCTDIGFKVWMCPWVKTTHMGTFVYHGDLPAALEFSGEIF
jgi:hypothetical protein